MKMLSQKQSIPEIKKLLLSTNPSEVQDAIKMIKNLKKEFLIELESDEYFNTFNTDIYLAKCEIQKRLSELNG